MKATHEEIAVRAYFLWERNGRPDKMDQDHWYIAEWELQHDRQTWLRRDQGGAVRLSRTS